LEWYKDDAVTEFTDATYDATATSYKAVITITVGDNYKFASISGNTIIVAGSDAVH